MKRFLVLLTVCCLLLTVMTACSASGRIDDPYRDGYGNVSTTRDGRVNGTNDAYNGMAGREYNGTAGQTYRNGTSGTSGRINGNAGTSGYTGTQRGTGMAGGR